MPRRSRSRLRFTLGFALYFVFLWFLWDTPVVYPLKLFVVFLHEMGHAAMAVATGGSIRGITLDPRLGGACHCPGGNAFLTLSAGYLGSLGWGALILESGLRAGRRVDRVLRTLGGIVLVLTLLYLRGLFAIGFGLAFGGALLLAARLLPLGGQRALLNTLGLTSALYAILDIKSDVLDRPHLPSDAFQLAELTGVPTVVWGTGWIALALVGSWLLLLRVYRSHQ